MTQKVGRRPGKQDTRSQIIRAASAVFAEVGYAKASIRGIAQRAGVDPALVHHYAPPVVTADADQLAEWVGPGIDRYLHEPLPGIGEPGRDD
jgi:hypothetical protein